MKKKKGEGKENKTTWRLLIYLDAHGSDMNSLAELVTAATKTLFHPPLRSLHSLFVPPPPVIFNGFWRFGVRFLSARSHQTHYIYFYINLGLGFWAEKYDPPGCRISKMYADRVETGTKSSVKERLNGNSSIGAARRGQATGKRFSLSLSLSLAQVCELEI